jgi:hypothetical protein
MEFATNLLDEDALGSRSLEATNAEKTLTPAMPL